MSGRMVLPGSSCTVAWIGSRFNEASTTSVPRCCRIRRGPNSSDSSKPSVATISTRVLGRDGIGHLQKAYNRNPPPTRSLMPLNGSRKAPSDMLRHSSDAEPGITRKRQGRYWAYFDAEGKRVTDRDEIDRLNAIGLPPAYENAWFCADPEGHLQATGIDSRGRKQYRYHAGFREKRESAKYEGLLEFGKALPRLRKRVEQDLKHRDLNRDAVLAAVVRLLDTEHICIAN